jgi:predicted methyltransferase MtxX (methanogen marker protein 4)
LEGEHAFSCAFARVVHIVMSATRRSDLDRLDRVDRSVGLSDGELPVGRKIELPAELVNQMVMSSA